MGYWLIIEQWSRADKALEALEKSYPQGSKIVQLIERMRERLARIILEDTDSQADIEMDKLEKYFVHENAQF